MVEYLVAFLFSPSGRDLGVVPLLLKDGVSFQWFRCHTTGKKKARRGRGLKPGHTRESRQRQSVSKGDVGKPVSPAEQHNQENQRMAVPHPAHVSKTTPGSK